MAKDYRVECPDCDNSDMYAFVFCKGDGKCSACHGLGHTRNYVGDTLVSIATLEMINPHTKIPCEKCWETGQCQTCGGTGFRYKHYDDNEDNEGDDEEIGFGDDYLYDTVTENISHHSQTAEEFHSSLKRKQMTGMIVGIILGFIVGTIVCIPVNLIIVVFTKMGDNELTFFSLLLCGAFAAIGGGMGRNL